MRAHSSRHGTTRSISPRNCARRVVFVYFSKPLPASVSCERVFINTSRSCVMWLLASQHNARESGRLIQRFLSLGLRPRPVLHFSIAETAGVEIFCLPGVCFLETPPSALALTLNPETPSVMVIYIHHM